MGFLCGFILGIILGVFIMCLVQIRRVNNSIEQKEESFINKED